MYFKFEEDFVEPNIKCIPMVVRFKLDAVGIKLKLAEWSKMTVAEREHFATISCITPAEVTQYRNELQRLVIDRTGTSPSEIPVDHSPLWAKTDFIPEELSEKFEEEGLSLTLSEWQGLTDLQRFALLKLSRPGHENKNFIKAIREFGLERAGSNRR